MKNLPAVILTLASLSCQFTYAQSDINHWETAVFNNDMWHYRPGLSEPEQNWRTLSFDDTAWMAGQGGFGYGDNDDNTIIPECPSVYLRIRFNVTDTSLISAAVLSMDYDDAFVAYLNDVEVARAGISGTHPAFDSPGADHEAKMYWGGSPEMFIIDRNMLKSLILPGDNVLAIQVHNSSTASSDLTSNVFLSFGITTSSEYYRPVPSWFIAPMGLVSSNLPILKIITAPGETIQDEPKITANMEIIDNQGGTRNFVTDPGNVYSGKVGIEIRGRYSASLPQKPYGFETRDPAANNLNVPLFGMPEENDWVLTANYNDKTFLRNYLAFELFRKMGHYATRTKYCEVILNDDYQGIYLFGEKIKQDKNRVDISGLRPDENAGDSLTGGYIFKTDYYTSADSWVSNWSPLNKPGADVYFVYYDPKPEDLTPIQKKYLKDYVNTFESTLYGSDFADKRTGYRAYLDVASFVDYFLLGEITRNVDAYKKSRFFYKDRDHKSRLIHSGPPWDFDWAWKDITEDCINFDQTDGSGWAYRVNECDPWPVAPSWEVRLLQDNDFANNIHDRYFTLRKSILSEQALNHIIDSVALLLDEAQGRHYNKWQILGINVGTPEYGDQPLTYTGEIDKFKGWITRRLSWLDKHMLGSAEGFNEGYKPVLRIFPNPATRELRLESDTIATQVMVFNITGVRVLDISGRMEYGTILDISGLRPGLYIIKVFFREGDVITRKFVKK
jgi:hypothetical protein